MDSNVKLAVLQPPPRLSGAQARRLCEKIAQQAKNLRNLLMQLRDGEGWVALGYASWARCCETEFGYSKRHANRLIQAAEISQQVGPMGPASLPERQARELARVPEEQRQEVLDVAVENAGDKPLTAATIRQAVQDVLEVEPGANGTVHVGHNSGNNEWYTPPTYIEAARDVMGGIDCDPASSEIANRTVDATTFYTIDQDGLVQKWGKRVWMNPPYAQPHVANFAKAITDKHTSGEVVQACVLVGQRHLA